jgi:hypothetical protein
MAYARKVETLEETAYWAEAPDKIGNTVNPQSRHR